MQVREQQPGQCRVRLGGLAGQRGDVGVQVSGDDVAAGQTAGHRTAEVPEPGGLVGLFGKPAQGLVEILEQEAERGQVGRRPGRQVPDGGLLGGGQLADPRQLVDHRLGGDRQRHGEVPCGVAERPVRRGVPHRRGRAGQGGPPAPVRLGHRDAGPIEHAGEEAGAQPVQRVGAGGGGVAELDAQRRVDAVPGPGLVPVPVRTRVPVPVPVLADGDVEQGAAQLPQGVLGVVVGQAQRVVQCLVGRLERERVVALKVVVGAEQVAEFADAEVARVELGEQLGQPQGVGRTGVPGVRRAGGVEAEGAGERVEGLGEQFEELGRARRAAVAAPGVVRHLLQQGLHRPRATGRTRCGPEGEQRRTVGAGGPLGRRRGAAQRQAELLAQHLQRGQLADEVRVHRALGVEQAEDGADVGQLGEAERGPATAAQRAPQSGDDREPAQAVGGVGEVDHVLVQVARLTSLEAGRPVIGTPRSGAVAPGAVPRAASAERHDPRPPEVGELAPVESGTGQELRHAHRDVRPAPVAVLRAGEAVQPPDRRARTALEGEVGGVEGGVLLGGDAQVLAGQLQPHRVAPHVAAERGGFGVRVEDELGDVAAEAAHHVVAAGAECAEVAAVDVERLRVGQQRVAEVGAQRAVRGRAGGGPGDGGGGVLGECGEQGRGVVPEGAGRRGRTAGQRVAGDRVRVGVVHRAGGRAGSSGQLFQALVDQVQQGQRRAEVGAGDVQAAERPAPGGDELAQRPAAARLGVGAAGVHRQGEQGLEVGDRPERREVLRGDAVDQAAVRVDGDEAAGGRAGRRGGAAAGAGADPVGELEGHRAGQRVLELLR